MAGAVFVARERALGQLDGFLDRALAGQGTVCFVTGEAGSGKTALVTEFARRAQAQHKDLVVAVGQSDAQTGAGDAYLPFREVLSQLTGDVEAELARGAITQENAGRLRKLLVLSGEALVEVGPDLIGVFVPGVGLATRVAAFAAEKVGWLEKLDRLVGRQGAGERAASTGIDQSHIFEQYTNVLKSLAETQPLLLVLDDLQWADGASIDLLFRLGRRIGESRILIAGTYRPDEVALGRPSTSLGQVVRHPLEKVLAEFKRYFGDVRVDLAEAQEAEGEHFVDAFVDTEPNRLGKAFRQALYHHTGGHPLFTIELLRDMQERGDLVRDEGGRWIEGPVLDWQALPARVEGVIEERVGRLERELREALTVASVEGEDFTAEVVAGVQAADARGLIRRLSGELEKQHRLVNAQGIRRLRGQRLSLYRFQHNLFQTYLYNELDDVERVCLHEDVGTMLEELYGDQADDIAVQLAHHFVEAGIAVKAKVYLRRAGELAAARYAHDEALRYFGQALELAEADQLEERYGLLMAREKIWFLKGDREAQAQDLADLVDMAEALDEDQRRAEVAVRQSLHALVTSDLARALATARAAIRWARAAKDTRCEAKGNQFWGQVLLRQGDLEAAVPRLKAALALAQAAGLRQGEAACLATLGNVCYMQGDNAGAESYYEQALPVLRAVGDRPGESMVLNNLANVYDELGDVAKAESYYAQGLRITREIGDRLGQSKLLNNLAVVYEGWGDYARATAHHEEALGIKREVGDVQGQATGLMNLAKLYAKQGDYDRSRDYLEQSLPLVRAGGEPLVESEWFYYSSLLHIYLGDHDVAREQSQRALDIARDVGSRANEAYALTYLGRALAGLDDLAEAAVACEQALAIRRELGQPHLAMEPLAGLARVSLAQGDLNRARLQVEESLSYLKENTLDGTEEPFLVYLTCYRVLAADRDPQAPVLLRTAYDLLGERAAKISDEGMRHSFLENVPANRQIVREFERTQ